MLSIATIDVVPQLEIAIHDDVLLIVLLAAAAHSH